MDRKKFPLKFFIFLFCIWILSGSMVRFLPGDPLSLLIAESGTQTSLDFLREEFGLNLPWWKSLLHQLRSYFSGNFGHSILSKNPIFPELLEATTHTFLLVVPSFLLSVLVSILLAFLAQSTPRAARGIFLFNGIVASFPGILMGPIFMWIFGIWLNWLPIHQHWGIPLLCLVISLSGFWSRVFFERLKNYKTSLHFIAASGKGISNLRLAIVHWLLPCTPGLVGYLFTQLGNLLGGTLVMEILFDWPGLGSLFFNSVMRRDYPVIQAAVLFVSIFSLLGNAIGDSLESFFDGRHET